MLQGQLHIHFGTNLPVTQLWSLHGGKDYGLLGCATMSFGEWGFFICCYLHVNQIYIVSHSNRPWVLSTVYVVLIMKCDFSVQQYWNMSGGGSFLWVLLLLQHHTLHVKTYVRYCEILCLYDSLWHSSYFFKVL